MKTKVCSKCGIEKFLSEFPPDNRNKDKRAACCRECKNLLENIKHKRFPWIKTLYDIKQRCNNPNNKFYKYYGGRGIKCLITAEELKYLWFRDKAYLLNRQSIDRIDNNGDYCLENCRYIELSENSKRINNSSKYKKIIQLDLNGKIVKEWESIISAANGNKITAMCISRCVRGERLTHHQSRWIYAI
jgi:hypothetical protein